MSDLQTEAIICCMIVSNPGGNPRPFAWQKRVNDLIRGQRDALTNIKIEFDAIQDNVLDLLELLSWARGCVPPNSDCHKAIVRMLDAKKDVIT